jgi:hypothetical protein
VPEARSQHRPTSQSQDQTGDNAASPVMFWVGSNHGASIVKVEPLD